MKVRHIYFPALRAGLSKNAASTLCFLLSAVFHELLVSVPFHMVSDGVKKMLPFCTSGKFRPHAHKVTAAQWLEVTTILMRCETKSLISFRLLRRLLTRRGERGGGGGEKRSQDFAALPYQATLAESWGAFATCYPV